MFSCCSKSPSRETPVAHDREIMRMDGALEMCGGDRAFLKELMVDMKSEIEEIRSSMVRERVSKNSDAIYRLGHQLKGMCSNMSCDDLSHRASSLEEKAKRDVPFDAEYSSTLESIDVLLEFINSSL